MNETYMFIITELDFYQEAPIILTELMMQNKINNIENAHIFIDNELLMRQLLHDKPFSIEILFHPINNFYEIIKEISNEKISIIISAHGNETTGIVYENLDFSPENFFSELERIEHKKQFTIYFSQCFAGLYDISIPNNKNNYTLIGACNSSQKATMIPYIYMFILDQIKEEHDIESLMNGVDLQNDTSPIKLLSSIFLHTIFRNLEYITDLKVIDSKYRDYILNFNSFILHQIMSIKNNILFITASEEQKIEEIDRLFSLLIKEDNHLWIKNL